MDRIQPDIVAREEDPAVELCASGEYHENRRIIYWRDIINSRTGDSWEVLAKDGDVLKGQTLSIAFRQDDVLVLLLKTWTKEEGRPLYAKCTHFTVVLT